MKEFEILDWDSDFFGIKTARINSEINLGQFKDIIEKLDAERVQLIYFNSTFPIPEVGLYETFLLDKRVALSKKLVHDKPWHKNIKVYEKEVLTNKMVQLSRRVARRSKFFYDPKIPKEKVYELYEIWLSKSVQKVMATDVLVYEKDEEILGFATIKILNDKKGLIPLLSVDSEYEGLGISFLLMQAIEGFLIRQECEYLISETQARNLKALKVYERFGIDCEESHSVYHLWRKNP